MRLDELMGSLQTFEMNMKYKKEEKGIALQAGVHKSTEEEDIEDGKDFTESLAMITKNLSKILKKLNKTNRASSSSKSNKS